ncbi:MAG: winged helix-turn-helix domain-containing protein [Candidatus Thorarchaeota archaeon]
MSKKEKIDVDYKRLKAEKKEIIERINEIFKVETRYAIIMAINNFGSLNIKELSKILGKNEATIYHHIKNLTDPKKPKLLIIDSEKTERVKGKFYLLSDLAKKYFGEPPVEDLEKGLKEFLDRLISQTDEEIARVYMELSSKHPSIGTQTDKERRNIAYNHTLENIMLNNLEQAEKAFLDNKKPKNPQYPMGSIMNFPLDMKISKPKHVFEIMKLFTELSVNFHKLKEKIEREMNKANMPEEERIDVHYHIVGGEIAEFRFE